MSGFHPYMASALAGHAGRLMKVCIEQFDTEDGEMWSITIRHLITRAYVRCTNADFCAAAKCVMERTADWTKEVPWEEENPVLIACFETVSTKGRAIRHILSIDPKYSAREIELHTCFPN